MASGFFATTAGCSFDEAQAEKSSINIQGSVADTRPTSIRSSRWRNFMSIDFLTRPLNPTKAAMLARVVLVPTAAVVTWNLFDVNEFQDQPKEQPAVVAKKPDAISRQQAPRVVKTLKARESGDLLYAGEPSAEELSMAEAEPQIGADSV